MKRREFLRAGMLTSASLALERCAAWEASNSELPNIIFILADDLGYGDLGCYGQQVIQTPHIDRMAFEGMLFRQHYAGCTVCAPSRSCLLTGLHTGHTWMRGNGPVALREDPHDITVARLLKDAGYHTAMIGKSSASCNTDDPGHPNRKGFDHFFGFLGHGAAHRYFPARLYRDGQVVNLPGNEGKRGDTYSHDLFLRETLDYLEQHRKGPFFLHVSMQLPHADLYAPREWRDKYLSQFEEKPYAGRHYRAEDHPLATFAGMVSRMDWEVGQILARLKELEIERNTLVLFSSDNGAMSEGGHSRESFDSSGALRGGKRDLYEGGIRVPLIARWPGSIDPGTESEHISAFWDFLPTACELAGTEAPRGSDGVSYLPALLGNSREQWQHEYLYWEFHERGGKRAIRIGNWKAVQLNVADSPDGPVEVYDLGADLSETNDLSQQEPDVVRTARRLFNEARTPSPLFHFRPLKRS